eukprot:Gb_40960 [translate_table: standard]
MCDSSDPWRTWPCTPTSNVGCILGLLACLGMCVHWVTLSEDGRLLEVERPLKAPGTEVEDKPDEDTDDMLLDTKPSKVVSNEITVSSSTLLVFPVLNLLHHSFNRQEIWPESCVASMFN